MSKEDYQELLDAINDGLDEDGNIRETAIDNLAYQCGLEDDSKVKDAIEDADHLKHAEFGLVIDMLDAVGVSLVPF